MPSHQRRQKCRQGMSRCLKRTGKCLERIVEHKAFERFITGCIILNTILMAAEHHGIYSEEKTRLKSTNYEKNPLLNYCPVFITEEPRLLSEIQNICSHVRYFIFIFIIC